MRSERYLKTHVVGVTALLGLLAWAIGRSGLDLFIAHLTYDDAAGAFVGRHSHILSLLADRIMIALPLLIGACAVAIIGAGLRRPDLRPFRGVCTAVLVVLVAGPVAAILLKHLTALPRPHMLQLFGGALPLPTHFFALTGQASGGALPSTHAAAGYALFALYFAARVLDRPALMRLGLALAIAWGAGLSVLRIVQGAHFLSQTVWSAAMVWLLASLIFLPLLNARDRGVLTKVAVIPPSASASGMR